MSQPASATERIETFINDVLKEELKHFEEYINKYNEEIMEFVQLKNTLQTMCDHLDSGFKTQVNIGSNIFMEAHVTNMEKLLVDIGANCHIEMSPEEAIKFAELRIRVLTKESDVLREASVRKRTEIKLALLAIHEHEQAAQVKV